MFSLDNLNPDRIYKDNNNVTVKEDSTSINNLPDEMLLKIFEYLPATELNVCRQVNRQFKKIAEDSSFLSKKRYDLLHKIFYKLRPPVEKNPLLAKVEDSMWMNVYPWVDNKINLLLKAKVLTFIPSKVGNFSEQDLIALNHDYSFIFSNMDQKINSTSELLRLGIRLNFNHMDYDARKKMVKEQLTFNYLKFFLEKHDLYSEVFNVFKTLVPYEEEAYAKVDEFIKKINLALSKDDYSTFFKWFNNFFNLPSEFKESFHKHLTNIDQLARELIRWNPPNALENYNRLVEEFEKNFNLIEDINSEDWIINCCNAPETIHSKFFDLISKFPKELMLFLILDHVRDSENDLTLEEKLSKEFKKISKPSELLYLNPIPKMFLLYFLNKDLFFDSMNVFFKKISLDIKITNLSSNCVKVIQRIIEKLCDPTLKFHESPNFLIIEKFSNFLSPETLRRVNKILFDPNQKIDDSEEVNDYLLGITIVNYNEISSLINVNFESMENKLKTVEYFLKKLPDYKDGVTKVKDTNFSPKFVKTQGDKLFKYLIDSNKATERKKQIKTILPILDLLARKFPLNTFEFIKKIEKIKLNDEILYQVCLTILNQFGISKSIYNFFKQRAFIPKLICSIKDGKDDSFCYYTKKFFKLGVLPAEFHDEELLTIIFEKELKSLSTDCQIQGLCKNIKKFITENEINPDTCCTLAKILIDNKKARASNHFEGFCLQDEQLIVLYDYFAEKFPNEINKLFNNVHLSSFKENFKSDEIREEVQKKLQKISSDSEVSKRKKRSSLEDLEMPPAKKAKKK